MAEGFMHTVHKDGGSSVNEIEREEGMLPARTRYSWWLSPRGRDEAIRRRTEYVVHNEDGSIGERTS
jgi:hypothetical protein